MAGIDIANKFPNSMMALAADLGQSRFRSVESTTALAQAGAKAGVFTITGITGTTSMAQMLTTAGVSGFSTMTINVQTSTTGVTIGQGGGTAVYKQGSSVTFYNVSTSNNPVSITTATADVVTVSYVGT